MGRLVDAVLAAGTVFGVQYAAREISPADDPSTRQWYNRLNKPYFNPPGPAYAVIWTLLDGLLAWSGYRLLRAEKSCCRTMALVLWALCVAGGGGVPVLRIPQAPARNRSGHLRRPDHDVRGLDLHGAQSGLQGGLDAGAVLRLAGVRNLHPRRNLAQELRLFFRERSE
ncbi:TspO/MBR family protein [Gluconobacter sphaericus]|uniref:Tryptophan-rich sensory protein n=1 Tax=Gluconobacter sphaericus NBRC 12467 TaxID=1307951 RepID=A0AA37WB13_9PROT|nr:hypothetical protein AA12467_0459 [Gluconobacter sphaericus NBRC 12467]GEB41989.1 hypothetical protein GSP01_07710 [Gluconobacter sphaericus NBRC 12467]GLQ84054.1 hypothetical protein GCM10007872_09620 [Gluconobacter sphaericus NBRC 12467]